MSANRDATYTTVIEFEGTRKRVRWAGAMESLKSFQRLMETHFRVRQGLISLDNTQLVLKNRQGVVNTVGLQTLFAQKLLKDCEVLKVKVGLSNSASSFQIQPLQTSAANQPGASAQPRDTGETKDLEIRSLKDTENPLQLAKAGPESHRALLASRDNLQMQGQIRSQQVRKSLSSIPVYSLKHRQTANEGLSSGMVSIQSGNPEGGNPEDRQGIQFLSFTAENLGTFLPSPNKLVVLHSTRNSKMLTNTLKLIPLSGKVVPQVLYNRVSHQEDEAVELILNPELSLVLKYNFNLVSNLTIFTEALNRTNSAEYLFVKIRTENNSQDILCDPIREDLFSSLVQLLACNSQHFCDQVSIKVGTHINLEIVSFLLSVVFSFYKYRTAKLFTSQAVKADIAAKKPIAQASKSELE